MKLTPHYWLCRPFVNDAPQRSLIVLLIQESTIVELTYINSPNSSDINYPQSRVLTSNHRPVFLGIQYLFDSENWY